MRTLFESHTHRPSKRTLAVSMGIHGLVLGGLFILPLISYAALPETRLVSYLQPLAPPPAPPLPLPPAPAPPPSDAAQVVASDRLIIPSQIPTQIELPLEEVPSVIGTLTSQSEAIGIPAGAAGNIGIPPGLQVAALPEPPKPKPVQIALAPKQVRISEGIVLSKAIRKVYPRYPPLAKRARVSGTVRLDLTIDERGEVIQVRVIEGHPLLTKSAKDAVSQWKFSPTILNGLPVQVKANINVVFRLN